MKRTGDINEADSVGEMEIVDTFTKLIFGEESGYSEREFNIIRVLGQVDQTISLDGHRDIGCYLRALGVQEMIRLVTRVHTAMSHGGVPSVSPAGTVSPGLHTTP